MIDLYTLELNLDSSTEDSLRDLLYATARRYNQACQEIDSLKALAGLDKPFPFLRLPREVRDQIYTLALRAQQHSETGPRMWQFKKMQDWPYKPPTPGLALVNQQLYREANGLLYAGNSFKFQYPSELWEFENRIGVVNRDRIQSISIWVRQPGYDEQPEDPAEWEEDSTPSSWIRALERSRLERVNNMEVAVEQLFAPSASLMSLQEEFRHGIEEFLAKNNNQASAPRLVLKGYRLEEGTKFPDHWEVIMDQWDDYKKELRGVEEELRYMEELGDEEGLNGGEYYYESDPEFEGYSSGGSSTVFLDD